MVAGRTGEEENRARGWWKRGREIGDRIRQGLERYVLALGAAVTRRITGSPTEDAERRKAGTEVEKSREDFWVSRQVADDKINDRGMFLIVKESPSPRDGKEKL